MSSVDAGTTPRDMARPGQKATDSLWVIVVVSFAIVLVGAAAAVVSFVFIHPDVAKPELILSLFTSAVGFLAGLFVPSPVEKKP